MKFSNVKRKRNGRWHVDLEFVITFYDAYVREKNLQKVAASMEIRLHNLNDLISRHPDLQLAKEMADENRVKSKLGGYVLQHLSPEARKVWDKLLGLSTFDEINLLFKVQGKNQVKLRQQLFCQALVHFGFDVSKACAMVGINRQTMNSWRDDLDFLQMLEEVQFHKKNFFENGLMSLCHDLHPGALIFANRTINADRGYNEKIQVEHTGRVLGPVQDFDMSDLDLDLETQKKVLAAIEKWKKEHGAEMDEDGEPEDNPMQTQALTMVK